MATRELYIDDQTRQRNEDQFSEESISPKKLSRYVDKENVRSTTTVQTIQTSKNYPTIDKRSKAYGQQTEIQIQENAQPLRDKINNSPRRYSEMTRDEFQKKIPLAQSEYLPQTQAQAYPQRSASLGNRVSAPFQLNQNDISITVTNPERRGNAVHKNTYYNLQGSDKDGPFQITRSHDDFLKIRHVLVKRWPGCYVPSVPPKRVLTKVDDKFLEGRRKELEMFAQKMTELPHLHYSREYQLFLRSTSPDFDTDMAPFQAISYDDVINRYKTVFKQPLQLRATPEAEKKIQDFKEFLQTVHSNFKSFKKVLKKTVAARKGYYEQLLQFHQIMSSGYETSVLSKLEKNPETNKVYSSEHGDLDSKVEGVKQAGEFGSIEYLHAWMKAENREISAFLEAIHKKEEYDDKRVKATQKWSSTTRSLERAMSGKRSLGAILTFKTSDQEVSNLEGKAVHQDKEQKQLQLLFDYIVLILAHSEIDRFKQRKTEQYHHVVNLAAQYELENLKNLTEYWSTILTIDSGIDKGSVISEN